MSLEIIRINTFNTLNQIPKEDNCIFFYSTSLDNRSTSIFNHYSTLKLCKILYEEDNYSFSVECNFLPKLRSVRIINLQNELIEKLIFDTIYLDATSLGFAELLLLLDGINKSNKIRTVKIIYAEPEKYAKKERSLQDDEFDLTNSFKNSRKIPPFSLMIDSSSGSKAELIVLLGFENDRLGRILENDDGAIYEKITPVVALPAFTPGWENISLRRHHSVLNKLNQLEFSPANNPYETYEILKKIKNNSRYTNLIIAPIGTKPHGLGAIVFLINSKEKKLNIGIVFDFPIKKEDRTDGLGKIHIYTVMVKPNTTI